MPGEKFKTEKSSIGKESIEAPISSYTLVDSRLSKPSEDSGNMIYSNL
jgi:hypothetical protein